MLEFVVQQAFPFSQLQDICCFKPEPTYVNDYGLFDEVVMWYGVNDQLAIYGLTYNFLPSWWRQNYGLTFGERIVFDPDYRLKSYRFMERTVHERFPVLHIGSPNPPTRGILPDFGNTITAAAAGCEVIYPIDNYPWNHHLPAERIHSLHVPVDISQTFPYSEIKSQVEYLRSKLGLDFPVAFNSRGVLNDAMLIGGVDFFTQLAEKDPHAVKLVEYSYGMLHSVIQYNYHRWQYKERTFLTNCAVMMVSPTMYQHQFLTYDQAVERLLAGYGTSFGLHHCGGFERYAPMYRQLNRLDWIEIGWGSDLRLALELFPEATVQLILSAVFVANARRGEVRTKIMEILDSSRSGWHRLCLSMPDVEYGTPDENLEEIYWCCKEAQ